MAKRRRATAQQATQDVQLITKDKRDEVNDGFIIVEKLIQSLAKKDSKESLIDSLESIKKSLLSEEDKKALRKFQAQIAACLRAIPGALRLKFERVKFYLWVMDNVANAREMLPLLDDLGWCPDTYMNYIKSHMNDAKFGYKTFDN